MTIVYFAGLGSMGLEMALFCLRAGHQVYGYDPTPEQVAPWSRQVAMRLFPKALRRRSRSRSCSMPLILRGTDARMLNAEQLRAVVMTFDVEWDG